MQRLYSMFPKGAPGIALALMRLSLGAEFARDGWWASASYQHEWLMLSVAVLAVCLCLGLFTPMMCAICAVSELVAWALDGLHWDQAHACTMMNAVSLALLGPGAYSLDGRAFGRRQIVFPPSDPPEPQDQE